MVVTTLQHSSICDIDTTIKHVVTFLVDHAINAAIVPYSVMEDTTIPVLCEAFSRASGFDFILAPLGLGSNIFGSGGITHANWLCYNPHRDQITRFEPLGAPDGDDETMRKTEDFMDRLGIEWKYYLTFDLQGPHETCRIVSTMMLKDYFLVGKLLKRERLSRRHLSTARQQAENQAQSIHRPFNIPRQTRRNRKRYIYTAKSSATVGPIRVNNKKSPSTTMLQNACRGLTAKDGGANKPDIVKFLKEAGACTGRKSRKE